MTTEKNSTHSPTYCASKTGIPNLWIVNLIEIAKVLIEKKKKKKKKREEQETKYSKYFPIFSKKYLITNMISGFVEIIIIPQIYKYYLQTKATATARASDGDRAINILQP